MRNGAADAPPDSGGAASRNGEPVRPYCVSLDIEVGRDERIHAVGVVRTDTGRGLVHSGGGLAAALAKLDAFAEGASFVPGHNLIVFDLPRLKAAKPDLGLLEIPVIDTRRLGPLAFPRNRYHGLVKHYRDGGLKRGRINDPELDSRIALKLFSDEREALAKAAPDLLAAWHRLCTPEPEGADRALDGFFREVRRARRSSQAEAATAIGRRLEGAACTTVARSLVADADEPGWPLSTTREPDHEREQGAPRGAVVAPLRVDGETGPGVQQHGARVTLRLEGHTSRAPCSTVLATKLPTMISLNTKSRKENRRQKRERVASLRGGFADTAWLPSVILTGYVG